MLSNVIVDVTIPRRSFVFGQSRAKVSAGFTNVRSLAVAAFDLVYCSLSVLRFVFVLDISKHILLHVYYNLTIYVLYTNSQPLNDVCLLMSGTIDGSKTHQLLITSQ